MPEQPMYHDGARAMQDRFDSRRIADRLEQVTVHTAFSADDRALIERSPMFFLATADADGWPDCSYKGGMPGFVRVVDPGTLELPSYDGNGMFRSLGNIVVNPKVGLLFIDFDQRTRMRVNGIASIVDDAASLTAFPGAQAVVRVEVDRIQLRGLDVAAVGSPSDDTGTTSAWRTWVAVESADRPRRSCRTTAARCCHRPTTSPAQVAQPCAPIRPAPSSVCGSRTAPRRSHRQRGRHLELQRPRHQGRRRGHRVLRRRVRLGTRPLELGDGLTATMWCRPGYADWLDERDPSRLERHGADGVPDGFGTRWRGCSRTTRDRPTGPSRSRWATPTPSPSAAPTSAARCCRRPPTSGRPAWPSCATPRARRSRRATTSRTDPAPLRIAGAGS